MFPQGLMSQAYFLCMVCGGGILIFNFVMGHMDGNDSGGDHGGHFHSDHGGDLHHGGHHHDGDHGGDQHDTTHKYAVLPMEESLTNRIAKFLLGMLSPMSMCMFLFGFGIAGYVSGYMMPWLGYLTLLPGVIAGLITVNLFKAVVRVMLKNLTSSSHVRTENLVGHVADVQVPMIDGRLGEVTYILESKLHCSAAKPSKPGVEIKRGTKVMIVETQGHTLLVEPYEDALMEEPVSR